MTKVLKTLTILLWILILTVWIGDLWVGIPADVSDDVSTGLVGPICGEPENAILTRRVKSISYLIPALMILALTLYGILKKKDALFYVGMILTIIPLLILIVLGFFHQSEMPYKNVLSIIISGPLSFALIIGLKETLNKMNHET